MAARKRSYKSALDIFADPMWQKVDKSNFDEAYQSVIKDAKAGGPFDKITPDELMEIDSLMELYNAEREAKMKVPQKIRDQYKALDTMGGYKMVQAAEDAGLTPVRNIIPGKFEQSVAKALMDDNPRMYFEQLADRVNMLGRFVSYDMRDPLFYQAFTDLLEAASNIIPKPILNVALSTASANADPVTELRRLVKVAPYVSVGKDNKAYLDVKKLVKSGVSEKDNFIINTGKALAEAINTPDYLANRITGQAAKTNAYTVAREDFRNPYSYVGDNVDISGQLMAPTGKKTSLDVQNADTSSAFAGRNNQLPGRILAQIAQKPYNALQANAWGRVRMARLPERRSIDATFSDAAGDNIIDILNRDVIVKDDVRDLAERNYNSFADDVRAGNNPNWTTTPEGLIIPTRDNPDILIPVDKRNKNTTALQRTMLKAAEDTGTALRGKARGAVNPKFAALMLLAGAAAGAGGNLVSNIFGED